MPDPTTIGAAIGTALAAAGVAAWQAVRGKGRKRRHVDELPDSGPDSGPESSPPRRALPPTLLHDVAELARRMQALEQQSLHWITDDEFGVAQREHAETLRRLTAEVNRAIGRIEQWAKQLEREHERLSQPEVRP